MKIKVVTSIVGNNRDILTNEIIKDNNSEYIAYTNQSSDSWIIKPACNIFKENKKNAKIHKILIHQYEQCDVSIWVDGNVHLLNTPTGIVNTLLKDNDIAISVHPNRKNIFEEADRIIDQKVDYAEIVNKQLEKYKKDEEFLKQKDLLCFATVVIRRHNKKVEDFNNHWWSEICYGSFRDQLSLPYVLSKHDIKTNIFSSKELKENFLRYHHEPIRYS